MSEYRINSADIAIRCDATVDDLIDVLEAKSRSYIPVIYVLNKIDAISIEELDLLYRIPNAVPISSEHGWNVDELMEVMCVFPHVLEHSFRGIRLMKPVLQVGETETRPSLHEAEGQDARLFLACCAPFNKVYSRRLRKSTRRRFDV